MIRTSTALSALYLFAILSLGGCAAPQAVQTGAPLATERGVRLGEVVSQVVVTRDQQGIVAHDIDPAALMRQSLAERLTTSDLERQQGAEAPYRLDVTVVDYEPGSAFARWLLPGLGATVLEVSGAVVDPETDEKVGEVRDQRAVYVGGFYTIGAWRQVFDQVANDIVVSLERGGAAGPEPGAFGNVVVTVDSWLVRDLDIPSAKERRSFKVMPVVDLRGGSRALGTRTAAFGVSMGNVFFYRDVPGFVAEMVAADLAGAGHAVSGEGATVPDTAGGGAEVPVTVEIRRFSVGTETTMTYWDIIAEIELAFRFGDAPIASASCREIQRTYAWPEPSLFDEVTDRCLLDLMAQARRLPVWQRAPSLARAN